MNNVICNASVGCPDNKPEIGIICPHAQPHEPFNFNDKIFGYCTKHWLCKIAKSMVYCIPYQEGDE